MLETAAASVFWMPSMAQSAATTGEKKKRGREKKKRKYNKVSGREIWIGIPGLLNAASVM